MLLFVYIVCATHAEPACRVQQETMQNVRGLAMYLVPYDLLVTDLCSSPMLPLEHSLLSNSCLRFRIGGHLLHSSISLPCQASYMFYIHKLCMYRLPISAALQSRSTLVRSMEFAVRDLRYSRLGKLCISTSALLLRLMLLPTEHERHESCFIWLLLIKNGSHRCNTYPPPTYIESAPGLLFQSTELSFEEFAVPNVSMPVCRV